MTAALSSRAPWTPELIDKLEAAYRTGGFAAVLEAFPERSPSALRNKVNSRALTMDRPSPGGLEVSGDVRARLADAQLGSRALKLAILSYFAREAQRQGVDTPTAGARILSGARA